MKRKILMAALMLTAVAMFSGMSFAHNTASGCASRNDVTLSDQQNWKSLCSKSMTLTDGTHYCVATASAEVTNPAGGQIDNYYLFTIDTESNPTTNSYWERTINLDDNPGISDPSMAVVSTTRYFNLGAGTYTFYWLGRPSDEGTADTTVEDYSMGIVCTDGN